MIIEEKNYSISEDYLINFKTYKENPLKLDSKEKENFSKLSSKSKVNFLKYYKSRKSAELSLIDIVKQSKYLCLLKDSSGFHIRIKNDLDTNLLEIEKKLISLIKSKYEEFLSEDINFGMSGDINRILISKGNLFFD